MAADALDRLPFPKYSVGLLQSETEMLQAPEHDLLPFLEQDRDWDVDLYTESTVEALVKSANLFDCVVVGYNAVNKRPDVRAALARLSPDIGVLVLHQLEPEAFSFLTWAPVEAEQLSQPARQAFLREDAELNDEILLRWPEELVPQDGAAPNQAVVEPSLAYLAVTPSGTSNWATVLETISGGRHFPVMLRRTSKDGVGSALCSLLLAPRHESHRDLLRNLLMWCCSGAPEAVVVKTPGGFDASSIQRKLRLQGVKAVVEDVPSPDELDFRRWPLWGTRDALLPEDWDPSRVSGWPKEGDPTGAMPWLRRGHRIILLGPGESLTVRHGESDAHWVASRWASWFHEVPTEVWHGRGDLKKPDGSIVATRAVLRLLAALNGTAQGAPVAGLTAAQHVLADLRDQGREVDPKALGVPRPTDFAPQVSRLLIGRLRGTDNIDETVSATVAALDIDALLESQTLAGRRADLENWLLGQFEGAGLEDRLEIARCLRDSGLLERTIAEAPEGGRVEQPVSAVRVTTLRGAVVACGRTADRPLPAISLDPADAVVDRELRMRPMLAAGYLLGVLDLRRVWTEEPSGEIQKTLLDPPRERIDRAVITLGRHGPLSRGRAGARGSLAELASTEALALIAYFGGSPVPTHVLTSHETLAPGSLTSLLQEAEQVRGRNDALRRKQRAGEETARRAGVLLALAGVALIIPVVIWLAQVVPSSNPLVEIPLGAGLFAVLVLGWIRLLEAHDLPVPKRELIRLVLGQGPAGVRAALSAPASRPDGKEEGQSDTRG